MTAKNKAITSLVLGIVGLGCAWMGEYSWIGILCAAVGLYFGIDARKQLSQGDPEHVMGLATGGLVCSAIALGLSVIFFVSCLACVGCVGCGLMAAALS